jgi:hypothetical protein
MILLEAKLGVSCRGGGGSCAAPLQEQLRGVVRGAVAGACGSRAQRQDRAIVLSGGAAALCGRSSRFRRKLHRRKLASSSQGQAPASRCRSTRLHERTSGATLRRIVAACRRSHALTPCCHRSPPTRLLPRQTRASILQAELTGCRAGIHSIHWNAKCFTPSTCLQRGAARPVRGAAAAPRCNASLVVPQSLSLSPSLLLPTASCATSPGSPRAPTRASGASARLSKSPGALRSQQAKPAELSSAQLSSAKLS